MTAMPHLELPRQALSVRQPWAWAIIHAGKDIENRSWQAVNHGLKLRGRFAIHVSRAMTKKYYDNAAGFMRQTLGIECPAAIDLRRGGIIGSVEVVDVVTSSDSPWFFGPRGLVLRNAQPWPFVPSAGALGYFVWYPADSSVVPPPAKWMLPKAPAPQADLALQRALEEEVQERLL
jgi:hypothetical protein